ncbi:MAG TPA: methyltransferase domain-containing protein [Phycisphaerae bacterium]|nr:methyltransferase domain-containing protein [Phycisphaerae bacterium]
MARKTVAPSSPRTLGPVSDLERHLPSDWWRSLFNSIYLKTDGDVVENEQNTAHEVDLLIQAVGLQPNDRVLDLCCGQGRHCMELARRGFGTVAGLDRSRYLIRLARKRARRAGLNATFHEGDARRFRLPESSFDCVAVLGNSFGYFEQEADDAAVLESIKRVLRSRGTLALDLVDGDWIREHFDRRSWEWVDENHFVCRERSLAADGQRLVSREVVTHAEMGVIADQFYAERLYSRDRIIALLEELGFDSVRDHGLLLPESERNQDLGMMARRMFITARSPHKAKLAPRRGGLFRDVTVILGDPLLPDSIKRGGRFNPEDFETTEKLKDALAELDDFHITYLENHTSLVQDLRADPPAFVFNLCDEGYSNDAFMELHVPALLEMLGIPYTGAGPACLAICYNKALVRAVAQSLEIPVPAETYCNPDDLAATIPSAFPALVKPNYGDSSVGITQDAVVYNPQELLAYLRKIRETLPGRPVLAQEFLTGPEYSVTIIGNPGLGYDPLPILEVDYSGLDPDLPPILGYESKWLPDSPYWTAVRYHEAKTDGATKRRLYDYSLQLFERLDCRDYARFDFRADADDEIKLLEVNPNPGWCWDGKVNLMAGFGKMRYADFLALVLRTGQERVRMEQSKNVAPAASPGPDRSAQCRRPRVPSARRVEVAPEPND